MGEREYFLHSVFSWCFKRFISRASVNPKPYTLNTKTVPAEPDSWALEALEARGTEERDVAKKLGKRTCSVDTLAM